MKTTAISFAIAMMSVMTFGQSQPQFKPAGEQASSSLYKYVREHIQCPNGNATCFRPGTEVIAFTVTATGELNNFRVICSVNPQTDEAMINVLKETSGNWEPGQVNGMAVDMEHEVALSFVPRHFDPVKEATRYLSKGNSLIYRNPQKALRYINEAYRLFPCNESVLTARSFCKAELGDAAGAMEDADRILALRQKGAASYEVLAYEER